MKKYFIMSATFVAVILLSNCHTAKKAAKTTTAPTVAAVTYHANIQSLVADNCSPCHFPDKGGNKKAFDSYDAAKANIDSMIALIDLLISQCDLAYFKCNIFICCKAGHSISDHRFIFYCQR